MNEEAKVPDTPYSLFMTPTARNHFLSLKVTRPYFSLGVKKTGCSGLEYLILPQEQLDNFDIVLTFYSIISLGVSKADFLKYFKNATIDCEIKSVWEKKIVFRNPNEKHKCGCGESFDVY